MKIGILTFHASLNFGSALQAFALQEYLRGRGHDVQIIDYRNLAQRRLYPAAVSMNSRYNAKQSLRRLLAGWDEIGFIRRERQAFGRFMEDNMRLTGERFPDEGSLRKYDWSSFDMLVSGSDQIWNPSAAEFSTAYFLDFASSVRKVAYAPSSGPSRSASMPDGLAARIRPLLSEYEALSVRERSTSEFLTGGDSIPVMPDPVLLHDADFYRDMAEKHAGGMAGCPGDGYILYYTPGKAAPEAEMLADAVSAGMMGKNSAAVLEPGKRRPVVTVSDGAYAGKGLRETRAKGWIQFPCGPAGFIHLIDHASCTVGTSFHLMAFSMLLGKDFWCPDAEKDSRKRQLADSAGLPCGTFFRFSDPGTRDAVLHSISAMRMQADSYWSGTGV